MSTRYSVDGLDPDLLILAMIRARYDGGAMPPGVYALWRKHFRPIGEAATKVVNRVRPAVATRRPKLPWGSRASTTAQGEVNAKEESRD